MGRSLNSNTAPFGLRRRISRQNDLLIAGWLIPCRAIHQMQQWFTRLIAANVFGNHLGAVEARVSEARWGTTVTLGCAQ